MSAVLPVTRGGARRLLLNVAAVLALGVVAGVLWWALAPRTLGVAGVGQAAAYPTPDYPSAAVITTYSAVTVGAGLLVGIPVVARIDEQVATRAAVFIAAGLPAALIAYGVGFVLGPPTIATQVAAKAAHVQVPLVLPSPLLALAWPAATAVLSTVGLLVSGILRPGDIGRPGDPGKPR